jgi:hypothetical protein
MNMHIYMFGYISIYLRHPKIVVLLERKAEKNAVSCTCCVPRELITCFLPGFLVNQCQVAEDTTCVQKRFIVDSVAKRPLCSNCNILTAEV